MNSPVLIKLHGTKRIVAFADGGLDLVNPKLLKLRKLRLSEEGREVCSGENYFEALNHHLFDVEVRNNDHSLSLFVRCRADVSGYPETLTTEPLARVNFYVLRPVS